MAQSLLQDKTFYGREWAFAKIAHTLESKTYSKSNGILVTGGPGCGKTAFSCELIWPSSKFGKQYSLRKRVLAYHFCQAQDISSLSLSNFINSLVTQLSISPLINGYVEKLSPEIEATLAKENCEANPDEAFKKAILNPLLEVDAPSLPCLLLVDSIDESYLQVSPNKEEGSRNIAELLATHNHSFPPWLILICSARKQSKSVTRLFTGFKKIGLDDLRKSHVVRDVQQYILSRLDKEEQLRQHLNRETAEMLNQLHIKSNGCFIYLEKVLDGVSENFIMLREVREIPGTLNGLYLWLCQRLFVRKQFLKVQPILNVILVSRKPLTEEQLFSCVWTKNTNLTREEFKKRLSMLSKVLIEGKNQTKLLFHHSFAEWLLDVKHCTQKYLCNAAEGHAMVAMRYSLMGPKLSTEEVYDFALHLSKIHVEYPLELFHVPLWMIVCGTPVAEIVVKTANILDTKIVKLLVASGAKLPPRDEANNKADPSKIPDDPIEALLNSTDNINQPDGNMRTLLHTAAYEGDASLVPRLIAKGADLEAVDKNGLRALNFAARQGHVVVVEQLLAAGANPNHADSEGWTPLRSAAWAGHTEIVDLLLRYGAEVDLADTDGRTALRAAAWGGHEDIVLRLLDHNANVNAADSEGRTPLLAAAYMGHREIVELLLDRGAEVNHADHDGRTALSVSALCVPASRVGHAGVVALLLERGAEVDHRDKDGMTPLLVAAFEGHSEVCELLLEGDADVDHSDNNGRTPLFAAASMGHPNVVNLLLFWGAAVDSIDSEGRTVLCIAASQGNPEVVRQLLDRGLDEMHRDNAGWTPLHYAAFEGHNEVCVMLLEAGAKINEVDNDGRIPLNLAAQEGHSTLVETLLQYDAKIVDHKAHDGKTACRVAALEGHLETVQVLINYNAHLNYKDPDGRTTLYLLAMENKVEIAEHLLKNGADAEASDLEGRTPLHVSAWQGHQEMVNLLLKYGANVNAVDNDQRSALQSASWQGHSAIVKILLDKNAWVDHACNQGATALCIAAQEGHIDVVRVLLDYGADPGHADQFGRNPLRVAIKGGHTEVIHLLEEYIAHLNELSRQGGPCSDSTTSLTSASTAETKPCSAILCQPGQTISPIESPESTVDKRKSLFSNQSSSKSSSNLTNSTGKSTQQQLEATRSPGMSFTQQLQQCTRKRNRTSRILSPLKEPHSPIQSPPQSPLSDHRISPVLHSHSGLDRALNSFVPIMLNPFSQARQPALGNQEAQRRVTNPGFVPSSQEPRVKRNGIVTNPNYKGIVGLLKSHPSAKESGSSFPCPPLRNLHHNYEEIVTQSGLSLKKETPL